MERWGDKEEKETKRTWERSSPHSYLARRDEEVRLSVSRKRGSRERERRRRRGKEERRE